MRSLIRNMGNGLTVIVQKIMPDAYICCLILTVIAMVCVVGFTPHAIDDVVIMWGDGFWKILKFSTQSSLALITGSVLSNAPQFKKSLGKIASLPNNHAQAIVLTSLSSLCLWYVHWGVGAVATGIIAVEIARQSKKKGIKIHYPLVVAAAYTGTVIWHNGFSGASQLLVATEGHFLFDKIGIIPVSETIFSTGNLFIAISLLIFVPFITVMMMPKDDDKIIEPPVFEDQTCEQGVSDRKGESKLVTFIFDTPIVSYIFAIIPISFLFFWMFVWKKGFDLNVFIILMLVFGLLLHSTLRGYIQCLQCAIKTAIPIMLQFQFYGGIMGILTSSGLAVSIANFFVQTANTTTFPLFSFLCAALVNLFVPSGGGQWIVQGPVIIDAALRIGVSIPQTITAFASGDALTNLLQPFWALPLLAIAGLKVRDIMGYCGVVLIFSSVIISIGLLIFPYI